MEPDQSTNTQPIQMDIMKKYLNLGSTLGLALALPSAAAPSPTHEKPRLVLQITVDQFRGDLPTRYIDLLGKGGLRYPLDEGIHYNNAHHAHTNTETIVGHVTLATGAHPAAHGLSGNLWFDRATGVTTYNIEPPDVHPLTKGADVDAATEIDPTQNAATFWCCWPGIAGGGGVEALSGAKNF